MSKLKIAFVLDDTLDKPDGVQQYVLTLGGWLSAEGHEVHYLVGQTARTDIPNVHSLARNLRVRFNGNRLSIPLPASMKRLRTLLSAQAFDVVHVQVPYSPFLAGRLLHVLPSSTAVVGTFHVLPYDRMVAFANQLLAIITKHTSRRFDTMISSTEPTRVFADRVYGFSSVIVPHPFFLKDFSPVPADPSVPTIVFMGRLVERKGAQLLLEAISYLRDNRLFEQPFRVVVGGKGELAETLQKYVHRQALDDIVSFVGMVPEAEKGAFLAQGDIAVFPSIAGESFGISLLEGLGAARGVVLGGNNPGYRAVLSPLGENRLLQPHDTADFAKKLAYWLSDMNARDTAAKAQKTYVRQFDVPVVGAQVVEIYTQALRSRRNVR